MCALERCAETITRGTPSARPFHRSFERNRASEARADFERCWVEAGVMAKAYEPEDLAHRVFFLTMVGITAILAAIVIVIY
jgi:hypothetical protein